MTPRARSASAALGAAALVAVGVVVVRGLTGSSGPDLPAVPEEHRPVVEAAARTCPRLSVPLLAAQIDAESGWRRDADSGHAQGISQFAPVTWAEWGRDGNGDGKADVWEPKDAIPSQARYMCHLYDVVADVPGDRTSLALAAYNAGPNAVLRAHGIPALHETRGYVDKIVNKLLPGYEESEARRASASPAGSAASSGGSSGGSSGAAGPSASPSQGAGPSGAR
ncbi:lytic transglycosylase domain-containing protein [Streptomyces sp. B1866]|uniref:lytic transglycosylase domain-containing protein n=1 Tax=Streptomyces sp. B1866 TaxID=3075431 RepID=UPI00288D972B|nr:lytic transglycosylase domain-containing protein [Streptomyces sp. B1866]MDT3400444.1 lytic transglycosylase domain-containing protein [Streptomyces sp. B1866]